MLAQQASANQGRETSAVNMNAMTANKKED
jgi:hypothetical protein